MTRYEAIQRSLEIAYFRRNEASQKLDKYEAASVRIAINKEIAYLLEMLKEKEEK